jgi:hypothetical protein
MEAILVSESYLHSHPLPSKYQHLFKSVPSQTLFDLLDAKSECFIAALAMRKGCLNSALFVEQLLSFLVRHYPNRINIHEYTLAHKIILDRDEVMCETLSAESQKNNPFFIQSKHIVLCTNGFEQLHIQNKYGKQIDQKFHDAVQGTIGYMS